MRVLTRGAAAPRGSGCGWEREGPPAEEPAEPLGRLLSSGSRSCCSIGSTRGCGRSSGDDLLSRCLFLSGSGSTVPHRQRPPPSLPIPWWWGWLQKVKSDVGKEQISDETRPFMLSDIKFHAEY